MGGDSYRGNNSQINYRKNAFFSTPGFICTLTELCDEVLVHNENQKEFLKEGLREINEKLPRAVYIPFVSKGLRNCCVLRICVEETRLFVTKSRAPFLICLEVYRPEEFLLSDIQKPKTEIVANRELNMLLDTANKQLSQAVIIDEFEYLRGYEEQIERPVHFGLTPKIQISSQKVFDSDEKRSYERSDEKIKQWTFDQFHDGDSSDENFLRGKRLSLPQKLVKEKLNKNSA